MNKGIALLAVAHANNLFILISDDLPIDCFVVRFIDK